MTLEMPYRLTTFDGVTLPGALAQATLSVAALSGGVATLGGGYDAGGAQTRRRYPYTLTYSATVVAASGAAVQAVLDELRGRLGVRGVLGLTTGDGAERWAWARLIAVQQETGVVNRLHQPVSLSLEIWSPWYGVTHSGALALGAGGGDVDYYATLAVDGTAPVRDAVITVTASGAAMTRCRLAVVELVGMTLTPVCEIEYTGTVADGASLVIDAGSWRCLNAGVDDFEHLHRTASHAADDLFELRANGATNILALSVDGGGTPVLELEFAEQWV